jgi:tetratricopeptide (TPR) repeat protein
MGAFEEASAHGREAVRIAEALDHPYSLIVACWGPAHVHRIRGEYRLAIPHLVRALALCRDWHIPTLLPITAGWLGALYPLAGQVAEGLSLLEEGQKAHESFQTLIVAQTGEGCLAADRLNDALSFAERALALARRRGQRGYEAWILRLLGELASHPHSTNLEMSERYYRQATALADELGMRPLLSRCHLGLGTLYGRVGKDQDAAAHLTTAAALCREMDMTG